MLITCNQPEDLAVLGWAAGRAFRGSRLTGRTYLATLTALHSVFETARRCSAATLESDLDSENGGLIRQRCRDAFPVTGTADFVCDTMRLAALRRVEPYDMDTLLDGSVELEQRARDQPVETAKNLADALPGFGIAAAVLGVVITMGEMNRSPAVMGERIACALLGTFLGIFLSYGFAGPVASLMEHASDAESCYYRVLRAGLGGFARGMPSAVAVELARRQIPPGLRPTFQSVELAWREEFVQRPVSPVRRTAKEFLRRIPIRNT